MGPATCISVHIISVEKRHSNNMFNGSTDSDDSLLNTSGG
jgi:hypothetical protein